MRIITMTIEETPNKKYGLDVPLRFSITDNVDSIERSRLGEEYIFTMMYKQCMEEMDRALVNHKKELANKWKMYSEEEVEKSKEKEL